MDRLLLLLLAVRLDNKILESPSHSPIWRDVSEAISRGDQFIDEILSDEFSSKITSELNNDSSTLKGYVFMRACARGYTEAVRMLLEDGRVTDGVLKISYLLAASRGYSEIVKLLSQEVDSTLNGYAIDLASRNGYSEVVDLLQ